MKTQSPEQELIDKHTESGHGDGAAAAESLAVETRETPTGIRAAVEFLRASFDETAHVLWKTSGPRNSHIDELAGVLVEIGENRRVIVVAGMSSGAFRLYGEIPGKTPDLMSGILHSFYGDGAPLY